MSRRASIHTPGQALSRPMGGPRHKPAPQKSVNARKSSLPVHRGSPSRDRDREEEWVRNLPAAGVRSQPVAASTNSTNFLESGRKRQVDGNCDRSAGLVHASHQTSVARRLRTSCKLQAAPTHSGSRLLVKRLLLFSIEVSTAEAIACGGSGDSCRCGRQKSRKVTSIGTWLATLFPFGPTAGRNFHCRTASIAFSSSPKPGLLAT